jgi:hypothetical protein
MLALSFAIALASLDTTAFFAGALTAGLVAFAGVATFFGVAAAFGAVVFFAVAMGLIFLLIVH